MSRKKGIICISVEMKFLILFSDLKRVFNQSLVENLPILSSNFYGKQED